MMRSAAGKGRKKCSEPAPTAVATIPLGQMKQWLHFTHAELYWIVAAMGPSRATKLS